MWAAWRSDRARDDPRFFPPELIVQIKAIACELPATLGLPLSRLSTADIVREAQRCGIVAKISDKTVWRWLNEDAIRPWQHRTWIFPRDPDFAAKAGRIVDLYARQWQGKPLKSDEFVISADEKTSIQARIRKHPSLPPRPAQAARVEHEYARGGAWAYLAALDVHRAKVFGRCEQTTGIKPFDRLVAQVMGASPYRDARHVFWIVDNGSSHRGQASVDRLKATFPNLVLVHGPVHASWLNQIEIYFSIVQRKALTPNDFSSLADVEDRLLRFQQYYESIAKPFEWKFSRADLDDLVKKIDTARTLLRPAA
ncbi:MAG: IS630 family transposase [Candidatus Binatia bacterium]